MNGFAWATYGSMRYWQTMPKATAAPVSVFDGWQYASEPAPAWFDAFAGPGLLPEPPGALDPQFVGGDLNYTLIPGYRVATDTVTTWTPAGFQDVTLADDGEYPWRVFVNDTEINTWNQGRLRMALNQASLLEFTVDDCETNRAKFTLTNPVELRNSYGMLVDVFDVSRLEQQREPDRAVLRVECLGALARLDREAVAEYSTTDEDGNRRFQTVGDIVSDLLNMQVSATPVLMGSIDDEVAARRVIWSVEGVSILGALKALQGHLRAAFRGHFFAMPNEDGDMVLRWIYGARGMRLDMSTATNLGGLTYSQDLAHIVTRLYLQGQQEHVGSRVALPDPGYLSRNEDTYGTRIAARVDNRVKWQESLEALGERMLDEYAYPKTDLRVNGINTRIGDQDARVITIGMRYAVADEVTGVDTSLVAQEVEYDLDDPLSLRLTISSRTRDMADLIGDMMGQQNEDMPPVWRGSGSTLPDPPTSGVGLFHKDDEDTYYIAHDGTDWDAIGAGVWLAYEGA